MHVIQRYFVRHMRNMVYVMSGLIISAILIQYLPIPFMRDRTLIASIFYLLSGILGLIPIFIKALVSLQLRVISIELLVSVAIVGALIIGEFSEAGIVAWLFLIGQIIEESTLTKTRSAVKDLIDLSPQTALRVTSPTAHDAEEVAIDAIKSGDYLLVKTGSQVPVDGVIVSGDGNLNEASITGESTARRKSAQDCDAVFAGSFLTDGMIVVRTTQVGDDTVFGRIIEVIEQAEDSKTAVQRFIDRFARYYTPVVILVSFATGVLTSDVRLAITILVLGCPGALVIGIPVSNVAGIGLGAKCGILVKGARMFHELSKVDVMVLDKTGTLTNGIPAVARVRECTIPATSSPYPELDINYVWRLAASLEQESTHPLATAVVTYVQRRMPAISFTQPKHFRVTAGQGVSAICDQHTVVIGNRRLLQAHAITVTPSDKIMADKWMHAGLSVVFIAIDGRPCIMIGIGDTIRRHANAALRQLRRQGIGRLIMLSGDSQTVVNEISSKLDLDEAHGDLLPQDKANFIRTIQGSNQKIAFVGDGINDGPALAVADLGIAMGDGTATTIEISDIVLLNSDITKLPIAHALAKATVINTYENIGIALITILILIIGLFTGFIYMASGMLVHEASILVVVINALRLSHRKLDTRQHRR